MKRTPLYLAIGAVVLPALYACAPGAQQVSNQQASSQQVSSQQIESATVDSDIISCEFPKDVPAANASQAEFDRYSWRMFTALNQAAGDYRGTPDCAQPLGSTSNTVWRSYKQVGEIFLEDGSSPGPWNSAINQQQVWSSISKVSEDGETAESTINQPVGGWLTDQQGNPTYYQIAANEVSYNYIVNNGIYNKEGAESFSQKINFPDYSVETKASWRIMEPGDDQSRYLTTPATVETFNDEGDKRGVTKEVVLGLVGLHIITKAKGYPQWVWATFEQVDNVTDQSVYGRPNSYFNLEAANDGTANQSPCKNHNFPCKPRPGTVFSTPDPLTRLTPIAAETGAVNKEAQTELSANKFMQYYELVTTQRPKYPNDPGNPSGTPTPAVSANTTMESYIQPVSSCMDCHSTAAIQPGQRSDFSFLFLHAKSVKQP
ncbi:MAG: hypothetical protein OIF57_18515 [Marinobacterium sp.]|nr:hypothetical protein [Marinobacterium sp.]